MLYVKLVKAYVASLTADRAIVFDPVFRCVDEDHQHHLFKELIASYDNHPDWRCERSESGFREYNHRLFSNEFLMIQTGQDGNPHWEPEVA